MKSFKALVVVIATASIAISTLLLPGCSSSTSVVPEIEGSGPDGALKVGHFPMRSEGPKTMDPIEGSTVYENRCVSSVYETLLQYKYLKRPFELEPLLLSEMPREIDTPDDLLKELQADEDTRELKPQTWLFTLRDDIYWHKDPCFDNEQQTRLMVSDDVLYSWKRLSQSTKSWWVLRDTVVGFDDYRAEQQELIADKPNQKFNYDAPVSGLRVINDREFSVTLNKPAAKFMWVLAMFQTSIVPREAVETYGKRFAVHPVGSGPYTMAESDWLFGLNMTLRRNPEYRKATFPDEHMPEDEQHGLHLAAGRTLPFLDQINLSFFEQDQPMWLHFRARDFDYAQVPNENMPQVFTKQFLDGKRKVVLKPRVIKENVRYQPVPLLDFIFIGFNMEDKLVGGLSEKNTKLRQAIASAMNWDERNETFYFGMNVVYDGVIPPMLEGHPPNGESEASFAGPNIERAKKLLAEAGYPNGEGLPVIDYYVSQGRNNREQSDMLARQLAAINIRIKPNLVDFPTLMQTVDDRKAALFSFAWGSDYPDGENNLALFYGPNESPGSNHFNYKREEYDRMYEQIVGMQPSPERTKIYETMQEMLLTDCPYLGSMARTRHYVIHERMKYFKPVEVFENWFKYVDIEK